MLKTDINVLRMKSVPANKDEVDDVIRLLEKEVKNTVGIGLAAIQIGIPIRVAIIRYNDFNLNLINTEVVEKYGKQYRVEECLSLPEVIGIETERAKYIRIKNVNGVYKYSDMEATIIQHELDHWEGILIIDRARK